MNAAAISFELGLCRGWTERCWLTAMVCDRPHKEVGKGRGLCCAWPCFLVWPNSLKCDPLVVLSGNTFEVTFP